MQKKPLVVNLFGSPGAGKSTGAAYIFAILKMLGVNAELITEFAKDKTWEKNSSALSNQLYMLGEQSYRISRCQEQVDVVVTDSPLFLSILYNKNNVLGEDFNKTVLNVHNSYNNINFFIERVKPYNPIGRDYTKEESDNLSGRLIELLLKNKIECTHIDGDENGYNIAIDLILKRINEV